jgi:indole-3-glycerol phosphate synthase
MNILDQIVCTKRVEIALARSKKPVETLEKSEAFERTCYSLREFLLDSTRTGIIAEFKRQSPSKGIINDWSSVVKVSTGYARAGASALSILTDQHYFGGHHQDLIDARRANDIPVLRKDFILDEYQIIEAKAIGADIILLIASILSPREVQNLARLAKSLGLSVLLEVHNQTELERSICDDLDVIGVNNRNLEDFSVSVQHSYELADQIPDQFLKIAESGISRVETIRSLKGVGFHGFLIGENFMKNKIPHQAMRDFVKSL